MTFNFLGPGLTVNVEAKVKEQIILDSSEILRLFVLTYLFAAILVGEQKFTGTQNTELT